jgi:hypothetical protein
VMRMPDPEFHWHQIGQSAGQRSNHLLASWQSRSR